MPPEVEEIIERRCQAAQADARHRGAELFCGSLCRLDRYEVHGTELAVSLSRTDYRQMLGTSGDAPSAVSNARADGIGVSAVVVTRDANIVVARRSDLVIDCPGMLDTGGGHVDPDIHLTDGLPDPFIAIRREVEDEFGVAPDEIRSVLMLGLARHLPGEKPELVFQTEVDLDFETLDARRRSAPEAYEMVAIQPIRASSEALGRFISKHRGELTSAGLASLDYERRYLAGEFTESGRTRIGGR